MRQRDKQAPQSAEETVRDIRRATRRQFSAEEKIRIVLEGLRGEDSIAELCRKEGIAQNLYLDDRTPPDGCVKRSRWIFTSRRNSASYLPRSHNHMRHMQ